MFTRIHHVAIVVRDMEQTLSVYRDVLGIPLGKRATVAEQGVHAALLPMSDGEIELLEPAEPGGGVARFLEKRGEGFHHLCFETPDVAAALTKAKAAGVPLIDHAPRPGLAGLIAFLHPKANHGVLVEMAQPLEPPAHPEPQSSGIRATGFCTVYVAVKDLPGSSETYARHFQGSVGEVQDDARFGAKRVEVAIGTSCLTLLGSADARSPVGCFLTDRGEGLFGVCLRVKDFGGALRHLEGKDIPTEVVGRETSKPLARLDPPRVHGINLFLSA